MVKIKVLQGFKKFVDDWIKANKKQKIKRFLSNLSIFII
jgi:hypothetical protein